MNDLLLCKPGEIFLKGLNKHYFEERLVANVKRRLKPIGHFRVTYLQSALYIEAADDAADLDAAYDAVRKVFGIATITRAAACEKDKDAITQLAKTYLHDAMTAAHSFKVETKRSDKRFPMTSIELSQYVGGELAEAFPDTVVDSGYAAAMFTPMSLRTVLKNVLRIRIFICREILTAVWIREKKKYGIRCMRVMSFACRLIARRRIKKRVKN